MNNKFFIIVFVIAIVSFKGYAQDLNFGFSLGYVNVTEKAEFEGESESDSESGFYIGALLELVISNVFSIMTEPKYANIDGTGVAYVPLLLKYNLAERINIQAGPQATIILEEISPFYRQFGVDLSTGVGVEITEHFRADARYSFGLTDRINSSDFDIKDRINTFSAGISYIF